MGDRVKNAAYASKVMSGEEAAALIKNGDKVGFAGFTGAGYPKATPKALAEAMKAAHEKGEDFTVDVFTGASTAPELDGSLADAKGMGLRVPYQSDPSSRKGINDGTIDYSDIHLSHLGQQVEQGFFGGPIDVAVIEVANIKEDGSVVPSASVGMNRTYLDNAEKIILEVNSWQPADLEGMHDIWRYDAVPNRIPIPITNTADRIGSFYYDIDPNKVVAVVETNDPDRNSPFKPLDDESKAIAANLIEFLKFEVAAGRMPQNLLPMQSGVGNIANAVLAGLSDSPWRGKGLDAYTEVLQDGMLDLLEEGTFKVASCTAFSLSPDGVKKFNDNVKDFNKKIVMRPQDVSNHPEVIRRLGVITCNGLIEADLYGNVNSTNIMGSRMQNGIGGSGDFTRNGYLTTFVSPSTAKGGDLSCIVPMVTHVDHTEHDTMVLITEQGVADLRGKSPRQRANLVIDNCAHPDYRDMLHDYYDRALKDAWGKHTPQLLSEAFSWHQRFMETGSMKIK